MKFKLKGRKRNKVNFIFTFLILSTMGISQTWGWDEGGVPVRQGAHIEWSRTGDVGEDGTTILGWSDTRTGGRDVYAQKIDSDGNELWGEDGLVVVNYEGRQEDPVFISDGNGGVYIIWSDFRNEPISDGQPYAQHLNSDGEKTWADDGVPLSDDKLTEYSLNMCKDGNGGVYALWKKKNGGHYASYLHKDNAEPTVELEVISDDWAHTSPSLETAGGGDALMVWSDERNDDKDIYASRLGYNGSAIVMEWEELEEENYPTGGIPVAIAVGDQTSPKVTYYSEDYTVIVWQDERYSSVSPDIFATFLDESGNPASLYGDTGLPIVSSFDANGEQQHYNYSHKKPRVKANSDGAFVIWNDFRIDGSGDIYVQKITHEDNGVWESSSQLPYDGIAISEEFGEQSNSRLTVDGNGGVYVVWENDDDQEKNINLKHLDSDGESTYTDNGLVICNATGDQISPLVRKDGLGGAFMVWQDQREGSIGLYTQLVNSSGTVQLSENGVELFFGIDGHGKLFNDDDPLQLTPKSLYLGEDQSILFWEDKRFGNQDVDGTSISTSYVYGELINSDFGDNGTTNGMSLSGDPVQYKPSISQLDDGYIYHFIGQDIESGENVLKSEILDNGFNSTTDEAISVDGTAWANQKNFLSTHDIDGNLYVIYAYEMWDPSSIWLQIYDENGNAQLSERVNIVSNSDGNNYYPRELIQHPNGGVVLVFDQNDADIRVLGISLDGSFWENSVSIIENEDNQQFQDATTTEEGVFITWKDSRNGNSDIFAQHISFDGEILSNSPNGISLCEENNDQSGVSTTFVSTYNTTTTCWEDFRNGTHWDVYCKEVDLESHTVGEEFSLSDDVGDQMNPFLYTSETYTVLAVWEDFRSGTNEYSDIYLQELSNGSAVYTDGGIVVSDGFHNQVNPKIGLLSDESNISYLLYWDDMRSSGKEDLVNVFAQQLIVSDCSGNPGGDAYWDDCGECDSDTSNDCALDCAGVEGGNAEFDDCGVCDGNGCFEQDCVTYPSNEYDCEGQLLSITSQIPTNYSLAQNYPNPFNPSTTIQFALPEYSNVQLNIYNVNGQLVNSLVNGNLNPGYHQVVWHGKDLHDVEVSNGIYIYVLETNNYRELRKMLFIK